MRDPAWLARELRRRCPRRPNAADQATRAARKAFGLARKAFCSARRVQQLRAQSFLACAPPSQSLARKPLNLAREAESLARRVATHCAQSKKPCTPRCSALRAKLLGLRARLFGLRTTPFASRTRQAGWRENARVRLGSVNGPRYSAVDTNTNTWGRGMGACAWVLERNGRLPGRDAWAAVGGETAVGRSAGDSEIFRAGQNWRDWQACAAEPLQINYLRPLAPAGAGGLDQHAAM